MEARAQNNQEEMGGIEFYETVSQNNEGYEIPRIAVSVLDNNVAELNDHYDTIATAPYAGLNGNYETLQTAPNQDHETRVWTERKQKVVLLVLIVLVITCVLISSVALVIALTIKEKDGGWSAWGSWGTCSTSCDIGLKSRFRTCTNPRPSLFGRFCDAENMQVEICESSPCKGGGWSAWGSWGTCSASCNVGLKSRFRTCTNPRASLFGHFCDGDNMQVEICESTPCKETHVAFNVYHSSVTNNPGSSTVIFTKILLNEGGAYNETSGIFTTPFSGLYQFNGHICTEVGKDVDYTLQTEELSFASGEHNAKNGKCTSFSAVASVLKDEKVWIKSQYLYLTYNDWNSFSGILIHKT